MGTATQAKMPVVHKALRQRLGKEIRIVEQEKHASTEFRRLECARTIRHGLDPHAY